ncbi:MAG: RraA family protein [Limisphaerales bacterium]
MNAPLTPEQLEALRGLDACTLANAIETFNVRLRNEGFTDGALRCLFPRLPQIVGYAATIKIRGSAPPMAANSYPQRTDWWNYVQSLPPPHIIVAQDIASHPGLGALLGQVHLNIQRALGCVGIVTNGAVRSIPDAEALGLQIFAGNVSVSHAYMHIVEFGTPVEVDGLKVHSGELLHGDQHGVQSIPLGIAAQIPPIAARISARKRELVALCQSPEFSLEKLRAAIAKESA